MATFIKALRIRGLLLFCLLTASAAIAQIPVGEQELLARLQPGNILPQNLLSTRSVVFYPYTMPMKELTRALDTQVPEDMREVVQGAGKLMRGLGIVAIENQARI